MEYLAARLTINYEYITALNGVSAAGDIGHLALLIGFRKTNETCNVAKFADRRLRIGVCAHVDCTEAILEDIIVSQVKLVVLDCGRDNGIVPCPG